MMTEDLLMNFVIRKTKNKELMYIQRSFRKDGKSLTKNVEKLGDLEVFMKEKNMSRDEVIEWGRKRAKELTLKQKEETREILVRFYQDKLIGRYEMRSFSGGYLFIQKLYYDMNFPNIFRNISSRHKFEYDLNAIFSDLLFARLLDPGSKLSSYEIDPEQFQKCIENLNKVLEKNNINRVEWKIFNNDYLKGQEDPLL